MKFKPPNLPDWKTWRTYHATVWGHQAKVGWPNLVALVAVLVAAALMPLHWWGVWFAFCGMVNLALFLVPLGRHYEKLDNYIGRQVAWQAMQQEIHKHLTEEGLTQEEADQFVWQMDLDVDRMSRGEPIQPPKKED